LLEQINITTGDGTFVVPHVKKARSFDFGALVLLANLKLINLGDGFVNISKAA
jgi:hypothetical protein